MAANTTNRRINDETEYDAALAKILRLMGAEPGTPESAELETLVSLVEAYEAARWPIEQPDSIDELRKRIAGRESVKLSISPAEIIRQERDSR